MNKIKMTMIAALVLAFTFATSSTALAHDGSDDGDSSTDTSQTTGASEDKSSNSGSGSSSGLNAKRQALVEKFKKEAETKKQEVESETEHGVEKKSAEFKQKACENRKDALQNRLNKKVAAAKKHKEVFDKLFLKVQNYHDTKNLDTDNYDQLVSAVETAQANATDQIAALESLDTTVDCTKSNVGDQVSTFQAALKATRQSLKDYRTALKNLIVAVHQSAEKASDDSQESTQ